jgi:hypothetical protein
MTGSHYRLEGKQGSANGQTKNEESWRIVATLLIIPLPLKAILNRLTHQIFTLLSAAAPLNVYHNFKDQENDFLLL